MVDEILKIWYNNIDIERYPENTINGGGYGHNVGMSQNGANQMAESGFSCEEILQKFFPETVFVSYESSS